jgi:hypothetical protein
MRETEAKKKTIFYKQVLQVACQMEKGDESGAQSLMAATELSNYITELEVQHRKKSGVRKVFAFAQPLVEGLMQYTSAVDTMIQADPTFSALIYGGAKLVLQVGLRWFSDFYSADSFYKLANGYTKYFEVITQMMADSTYSPSPNFLFLSQCNFSSLNMSHEQKAS